ncbi:MAG: hypothetical protein AB1498_00670 [bacterium]
MAKTVCATDSKKENIEIITRKDFRKFKIDESYVPYGAVVSKSNPYCILKEIFPDLDFLLQNKFGRDPWGGGTEFGVLSEINESEYNIFINIDNPKISAREKNEVLRKTLLKVVSQDNKIYYIIPGYLAADLVRDVRYEKEILVEAIKKYFPKPEKLIQIGTLEQQDSLLIQSLNHLFPHIKFITVSLHENLSLENRMDMFYFADRAVFGLFKDMVPSSKEKELTAESAGEKENEEYLLKNIFYILYHFLKPEGRIIALSIDGKSFNAKKMQNFYECIEKIGWWQLAQPFFKRIEMSSVSVKIQKINERIKEDYSNFQLYFGERAGSKLDVSAIEERLYSLNLPGVPFSLVSSYKNSFTYLADVLMILKDLIEGKDNGYLKGITKIQRDELEIICTDMRDKKERFFHSMVSLIEKMGQIKQIERVINPLKYQNNLRNPLLDNLHVFALFNFTKEEIEEIILIITGHSAMSGVVSGKLPGTALNPITDKVLVIGKEFSARQLALLLDIVEKRIHPDIKKSVSQESMDYLKKILDKRKISNDKELILLKRIMEEYRFVMENYFIPPKQGFELIKRDYLKSIAEFAAGTGGLMPAKKFERFSKLRREASDVIYNPGITWESIMEEKITNMGGTFWMALRRLLRIYEILRIDPILMKELEKKNDFEIEAIAGYNREMIREYRETRELIKIAREFKDKYYNEISFERPFFYRNLFEKFELHGTGRIFPFLSARAGFKLLWIACHVAKNNFIDFNPMFLNESNKEYKEKIREIESNLESINIETLDFTFLEDVKSKLLAREDVIIFDTGLELRLNEKTDYLEFRYSNIHKTIEELDSLMEIFRNKEVSFRNVNYLLKLENCANVIQKYPLAYRGEIKRLYSEKSGLQKIFSLEKRVKLIEAVIEDIRKLFIHEIFSPKEIGDNISLMSKFCPKVLEIVLNEFLEMRNIKSVRKEHIETVNEYIIRIAKKFQAVDTKTKSEFQDKTVFNRIAQEDFGEKTPISIEVSEKQLTQLEDMYDSLAMYPGVKRAMIVSILFFNIGKVPSLFKKYHKQIDFVVYPEAGVEALKREKILENLVDKNTEKLALFFIGQMGKLGQIIKSEYPLESIEELFSPKDKDMAEITEKTGAETLFTANTLLCILIASSVYEGLMTYDLMERFFSFYRKGLSIIKKEKTSMGILMDYIFDKGRRALEVINKPVSTADETDKGGMKSADESEIERFGREAYVLERLFAFRGAYNIYYDIVLEFYRKFQKEISFNENGLPEFNKQMVSFIKFLLYKQSFHSVGINPFTKQMQNAIGIYNEFEKMPEKAQKYLLYAFLDKREKSKFWLLERSTKTLDPETQLKIILFGLKAIDYRRKVVQKKKSTYISFFGLSKQVDCHYDFINKAMKDISYTEIIDNILIKKILKGNVSQGIRFKYGFVNGAVKISFYPIVDISGMLVKMKRIKSLRALENYFTKEIFKIKQCPYNTYDYQEQFKSEFLKIKEEIKDDIVNISLKKITGINLFRKDNKNILSESKYLLKRLEFIFNDCIKVGNELELSPNHFALIRDAYEITKEKIRLSALKGIISYQAKISGTKELNEFTKKCVLFINKNVRLFGMEISWELLNNYRQLRRKEVL